MSVQRIEEAGNIIRIHIHNTKPYGYPDEESVKEVTLEEIAKLPLVTLQQCQQWNDANNSHQIFVLSTGIRLVFKMFSYPELTHGPWDERTDGPYLLESEKSCPGCNKNTIICYHQDIGINRYYDRYCQHCLSCGYTEYTDIDGGEPGQFSEKEETFCPYCQLSCHQHLPVQDKFQPKFFKKEPLR